MAQFILICEHEPDECEALDKELQDLGVPEVYKGREFACSCPFGFHGGWVVVDAESADAAVASLGPVNRAHTKVHEVEMVRF